MDGRKGRHQRCREILDAAEQCFRSEGFHAASMSQIAGTAGISVGHIYRYFENKEAIVAAIAERGLQDAGEDIAQLEGGPSEVASRLMADILRRKTADKVCLMMEMLSEAGRNPKIAAMMRDCDREMRNHLCAALSKGAAGNEARDALEARVELICTVLDGFFVRIARRPEEDHAGLLENVRALLAALLQPCERTGRALTQAVAGRPLAADPV